MSTLIFLARHAAHADLGQRLSGRSECALTPNGQAAAGRLAQRLQDSGIEKIQSSPRLRARQTAQAVGAYKGAQIEITAALDEIDFGTWMGASFAELQDDPAWRRWNEKRGSATPPGGETMTAATARAVTHVEAVAATSVPTLLVTHCDIIRGIVAHYLGLSLDHLLRFDIDPASVTSLMVGPWGGRILTLNERV